MAASVREAKVNKFKSEVRRHIASKIFHPDLCSPLEDHIDRQISEGFLDRDVNRYLLKLYQMYPEPGSAVRQSTMEKILVLSFYNLPEDDFICINALLTNFERTEYANAIYQAYEILRNCEFQQFWHMVHQGNPTITAYFSQFIGLEEQIRRYIITILQWVYQNVRITELHEVLGFATVQETREYCENQGLEITNDDTIEFEINEANSATLKRKIIQYSVDQMNIFMSNMRA